MAFGLDGQLDASGGWLSLVMLIAVVDDVGCFQHGRPKTGQLHERHGVSSNGI